MYKLQILKQGKKGGLQIKHGRITTFICLLLLSKLPSNDNKEVKIKTERTKEERKMEERFQQVFLEDGNWVGELVTC